MEKGSNLYSLKFWGHIIYFFEKVWDDRPYLPNGDWFLYLMWEKGGGARGGKFAKIVLIS